MNPLAVLEVMTFFTVFSRMACFVHKISGNPAHMVSIQAVLAFSAVLRPFPLVLFDPWWLLALGIQCCTFLFYDGGWAWGPRGSPGRER